MAVTAGGTKFKLSAETRKAKSSMETMSKSFRDFGQTTKTSTKNVSSFFNKLRKNRQSSHNFTTNSNRMTQSMKSFNTSIGRATRTMAYFLSARVLGKFIQDASEMVEVANLFQMSMGSATTATSEFVTELQGITNLDTTNIRSAIGVFGLLTRSMGFSADNSQIISENMYKLALDLSSLTNAPIEQVLQNLKAGLVGQSEAVYKYGIDVTEASLKAEAMAQGISKSVRNMSQGEKMALRYSVMLKQTTIAQGDFARTLETPANQMRIFKEQVISLSRNLGTLLLPTFGKLLPYLNAIAKVLNVLVSRLATLVGYEKIEIIDRDLASNVEDVASGLGEVESKMKGLMGFDELNLLGGKSETTSGESGVSLGDPNLAQLESYDNLMDTVDTKANRLAETMLGNFDNLLVKLGELKTTYLDPIGVWLDESGLDEFGGLLLENTLLRLDTFRISLGKLKEIAFELFGIEQGDSIATIFDNINFEQVNLGLTVLNTLLGNFNDKLDETDTTPIATNLSTTWDTMIEKIETSTLGEVAGIAFSEISDVWNENGNNIVESLNSVFGEEGSFFTIINTLIELGTPLWETIKRNFKEIAEAFGSVGIESTELGANFAEFVALAWEKLLPLVNWFLENFGPIFVSGFQAVIDKVGTFGIFLANIMTTARIILNGILTFLLGVFTMDWERTWQGLGQIVAGVFSGVADLISFALNNIIDIVNATVRRINTIGSVIGMDIPEIGHVNLSQSMKIQHWFDKPDTGYMSGYSSNFGLGSDVYSNINSSNAEFTTRDYSPSGDGNWIEQMTNAISNIKVEPEVNVELDGEKVGESVDSKYKEWEMRGINPNNPLGF